MEPELKFNMEVLSDIVGWVYFLAWGLSQYPQIYVNWKRKSVVGQSFDRLALNIVGYSVYRCVKIFSK